MKRRYYRNLKKIEIDEDRVYPNNSSLKGINQMNNKCKISNRKLNRFVNRKYLRKNSSYSKKSIAYGINSSPRRIGSSKIKMICKDTMQIV
jgi:hypothetical protein